MNIEFFDDFPHAELASRMRSVLGGARRIDAAVAFVTRQGTAVLRELLEGPTPPKVRLVASEKPRVTVRQLLRWFERDVDGPRGGHLSGVRGVSGRKIA